MIFFNDYQNFLDTKDKQTISHKENNEEKDLSVINLGNYLPKIIWYNEVHLTNDDLNCDASQIANSRFFSALLKMMGSNIKELENTYVNFKESKNHAILKQQAQKFTKGLAKISQYFNDLYSLNVKVNQDDKINKNNDVYKFDIDLESSGVNFSLYKEETKPNGDKNWETHIFVGVV